MSDSKKALFGFLTGKVSIANAIIGGYLVLNDLGRPAEFHCTEPVKPNRAQEILFGKTLDSYLYGERIGKALTDACKTSTVILFTDLPAVLDVRKLYDQPIVFVPSTDRPSAANGTALEFGSNRIFISHKFPQDESVLRQRWTEILTNWDLTEPFQRIHEAIQETQKAA